MIEFLTKNSNLITILSSLATLASALIALATLFEVKRQRTASYKPDVLIKSFLISFSKSIFQIGEDEILKFKACDFNDYSNNFDEIEFKVSPLYKVNNLGFGVAKNVECQWRFDYSAAINKIQNVIASDFELRKDQQLNLYFLRKLGDETFHFTLNSEFDKQEIDYISPIGVQNHFHFHAIPKIIPASYLLFLQFKEELLSETGQNFHVFEFKEFDFPKPELRIKYQDINGKWHKRRFRFSVTAVNTQIDEKLELTREFCYLHFELK